LVESPAEVESGSQPSSTGVFPLRLRRQPIRTSDSFSCSKFLAERYGIIPRHPLHRERRRILLLHLGFAAAFGTEPTRVGAHPRPPFPLRDRVDAHPARPRQGHLVLCLVRSPP